MHHQKLQPHYIIRRRIISLRWVLDKDFDNDIDPDPDFEPLYKDEVCIDCLWFELYLFFVHSAI